MAHFGKHLYVGQGENELASRNPSAPRITGVFGCQTQVGNETQDCPTAGNIQITVRGSGFLNGLASCFESPLLTLVRFSLGMGVTVDGQVCDNVLFISSGELRCRLPESSVSCPFSCALALTH